MSEGSLYSSAGMMYVTAGAKKKKKKKRGGWRGERERRERECVVGGKGQQNTTKYPQKGQVNQPKPFFLWFLSLMKFLCFKLKQKYNQTQAQTRIFHQAKI
jgi:hypothetical protein